MYPSQDLGDALQSLARAPRVRARRAPARARAGLRRSRCRPAPRRRRRAGARPRPRPSRPRRRPTIGRSGSAACTSNTARTAIGWIAGPGQPAAARARAEPEGARLGIDRHAEHRVDERDRLRARRAAADAAMATMSRRVGAQLGPDRPAHGRERHAATTSCVAARVVREEVATCLGVRDTRGSPRPRRRSAGASSSISAAFSNSARLRPQMLATTRAPHASSAGRSCSSHASTPGPWRPTLLIIPAAVSCTRSGGLPGLGLGVQRLHDHRAERPRGRCRPPSSAPCPAVPDAVMIGLGSTTDPTVVVMSTDLVLARIRAPWCESPGQFAARVTRAPAGRVGRGRCRGGTPAASAPRARGGRARRCPRPPPSRRPRS